MPGTQVSAADSTLQQQILPGACSHTTVETGTGTVNDVDCPLFAPEIIEVNTNDGKPIITGVFDAIHTSQLRIYFMGRMYVLNTHAELTANGNVWVFDLSGLESPLEDGQYSFRIETVMTDDQILGDATTVAITGTKKPPVANVLSFTGQNSLVFVTLGVLLLLIGLLAIKVRKARSGI